MVYSSAAHLPRPVLHVPPVYAKTFLRDSVEQRPNELYRKSERLESLSSTIEEYGTKSLPLRSAVEHVPEG